MEAKKDRTPQEHLAILRRMRFEEDFNNLADRRDALDFAIDTIEEWTKYKRDMMDDGK